LSPLACLHLHLRRELTCRSPISSSSSMACSRLALPRHLEAGLYQAIMSVFEYSGSHGSSKPPCRPGPGHQLCWHGGSHGSVAQELHVQALLQSVVVP
jgi:hypothetical protein